VDVDIKYSYELLDQWKKEVNFRFTGNDIKSSLKRLSKKYKVKTPVNFSDFIDVMKKFDLQDLVVDMKIRKGKEILIGSRSLFKEAGEREKYPFQIMKVDRYQGIASMELGLINEQVTAYADLSGIYLFFSGLCSSYVTTANRGNDYYFLLFDAQELTNALKKPETWMSLKNQLSKKILREILSKTERLPSELITLSMLLNISIIESMERENIREASFRLIRISREGNTYKVYEDIPISLFTTLKVYQNKELLRNLEGALNFLINPVSKFIKGQDSKGDGYHAYMAMRHLYNYIITASLEYLTYFYRELHTAHEIDQNKGYLRWVLRTAI